MSKKVQGRLGSGRFSGDWLLLVLLLIIILGVIAYRPILDFTFFWEDPIDIGQVEGHSTLELFLMPTNNLYYRPLLLAFVKFLKLGQPNFSASPGDY